MKQIVAFAGSNSSTSINKQLVKFVLTYFPDFETNLLDLNEYEMPLFSVDREKTGFPEAVGHFREAMSNADAIVCSLAEHNRSYTVAFKNVLDWCSRIDMNIFAGKPMLLMTTSPGGYGGGNVMNAAKPFFPKCGAEVIESFSLPSFRQNFENGQIINETLKKELEDKIAVFKSRL
ncbi:NAD(P)H-dependent oxidoreductase [Fulvivirga ulvae]|uniref:NADPH-dependent FMN reductase n=1 Tax=Fulvivirga ulvae TaxID=2904245 RepID=UPI001F39EA0F|nr:NAD(P)H-dependent oxidoreductase [Fulvivirga ulvae]UII30552.1 NAD(P)H-dependent oxidoreductase [Fulvivirga ulvae]